MTEVCPIRPARQLSTASGSAPSAGRPASTGKDHAVDEAGLWREQVGDALPASLLVPTQPRVV
jgi:hypothetical protein